MADGVSKTRDKRTKVRTGCQQCKRARVKCAEEKPACSRCRRIQLPCKYGAVPSTAEPQNEMRMMLPAAGGMLTSSTLNGPVQNKLEVTEATYFEYFRHHVVHELAGNQPSGFWEITVFRQATIDEHIRDSVVSIGALAWASKLNTSNLPLHSQHPQAGVLGRHCQQAIRYYTRALNKFRARISTKGNSIPLRTVLITTVLFTVFELLQGNITACDHLSANGLAVLKDKFLRYNSQQQYSLLAAPLDDAGIKEAEFTFARIVSLTTVFSIIYPRGERKAIALDIDTASVPMPPDTRYSIDEFWTAWWRVLTLVATWGARVSDPMMQACSPREALSLTKEQDLLTSRAQYWIAAAKERLCKETNRTTIQVLKTVILTGKIVYTTVYCALDRTCAVWDSCEDPCLDIIQTSKDYAKEFPRIEKEHDTMLIYDGMLPGLAQIARQCRSQQVRLKALGMVKELVSSSSSWDIKAIFLGTSALLAAEELCRDASGNIPLDSRYDWTNSFWNDKYTELTVILTEMVGINGQSRKQKRMVLPTKEFNLI